MRYDLAAGDGELGPYGTARASYFRQQHGANLERRRRAAAEVDILESNLDLQVRRLDRLQANGRHDRSPAISDVFPDIEAAVAGEMRYIEDLRAELLRQRRLMAVSHADRLAEWAVEHDERRLPEQGEIILARRSKKPWQQHSFR